MAISSSLCIGGAYDIIFPDLQRCLHSRLYLKLFFYCLFFHCATYQGINKALQS